MPDDPTSLRTVHLYVCEGFADWEPAYTVAGIHNPAFQRDPGPWRVRTVGDTGDLVRSMGGLAVLPDMPLDLLSPADSALLILPGGAGWDAGLHARGAAKAAEFLAAGVPVAAICGATAGLAREGLLDERDHTSAVSFYLAATGVAGGGRYVDTDAVTDGNLITAGPTEPVAFAREILRLLGVYEGEVLDAWYRLFHDSDPQAYAVLEKAAGR